MKNKIKILAALVIMMAVIFTFTGCFGFPAYFASQMHYHNWGVFGEAAVIPVKDFESVGLVFTEVSFILRDGGNIEGQTFTYQALLREAAKIEADAIINVAIDKKWDRVVEGKKSFIRETWYGSALAIKYTNAMLPPHENANVPVNARRIFDTKSRLISKPE